MIRSFLRRNRLFLVNLISGSGLLGTSDLVVQVYYEKKTVLDKTRLFGAFVSGGIISIEGHVWYSYLDRIIVKPTWHNVFKKVILDQTIAAPIYTLTYIVGSSFIEGRTLYHELIRDIKINFPPLYLVDTLIFAPIQIINFKYVPPFYRIPFASFVAFIFDSFISAYKHQHDQTYVHNNPK